MSCSLTATSTDPFGTLASLKKLTPKMADPRYFLLLQGISAARQRLQTKPLRAVRQRLQICYALTASLFILCSAAQADQILLSAGQGSQPDSRQDNRQVALDYEFFRFERSPRSHLSIGVGYTKLTTDASVNKSIDAVSFYPQLTLYPERESLQGYYFFVRALGASYISANALGDREQDNNFSFQAQVGVGYEKKVSNGKSFLIQISRKHFSNANLFHDNDGIDVPLVFTLGYKF